MPKSAPHGEPGTESLYVVFVCTGNICRSPMGEIIARDAVEHSGLADDVRVASCGTGGWHVGEPADRRTQAELAAHGYDPSHVAAQLGPNHLNADLFVAMDEGHVRELQRAGVAAEKIRLMRSFDPQAPQGAIVADPYYGDRSDFVRCREEIEAATPGLVEWLQQTLAQASQR